MHFRLSKDFDSARLPPFSLTFICAPFGLSQQNEDQIKRQRMNPETISRFLEQRMKEYLSHLERWVGTNSHTANPEGVNRHGRDVAELFSRLGFKVELIKPSHTGIGDHLVLTCGAKGAPTIGLISHLDTVFSPEEERRNDFRWRQDGDKIYGPGTIDIKGGTLAIYMLIDAIKELEPEVFSSTRWVVLLDSAEEIGGPGFYEVCREQLGLKDKLQAGDMLASLVFETGLRDSNKFTLVTSRKGRFTGKIKITGRAAHAGICPEKGASAIRQLARTIEALESLNNYPGGVSVNVGTCGGGTEVNTVAETAELEFEMRARTAEALAQAVAAAKEIAAGSTVASAAEPEVGCKQMLESTQQVPVWPDNSGTKSLLEIWQRNARALGAEVVGQSRGGGSDGNLLADKIPTIDGLGPSGANLHCSKQAPEQGCEQEYVSVSSFVPKTVLNFLSVIELRRQR